MATKRPAPSDGIEPRRNGKRSKPNNFSHQQRPAHHGKKSFKKAHPVNELRTTVRSLRRLLDRNEDLPAGVRIDKERALQTAQRELAEAEKGKKRSDMIGKYHKIRFFERQKAERKLKKAKKELLACEDAKEKKELEGKVRDYEVDVNYAIYFPLERDYVSLFPRRKDEDGEGEGGKEKEGEVERQGDKEMWELVRKCMEEGTLGDLREGRLGQDAAQEDEEEARPKKAKNREKVAKKEISATKRAGSEDDESDDESGGGFFE